MSEPRLRMPPDVERLVLGNREKFREMNARAQALNQARREADPAGTPVQIGFVTKPDVLEDEQHFWDIEDDQVLEDFLFDDLLAGLYGESDLDWANLPPGYEPLLRVLEFERHCQFEGWTAVSNKGADEMRFICESYQVLGLDDEARALTAVTEAYVKLGDDDHDDFHEILGQAYRTTPNETPEIEDRLPLIFAFVRAHPALFGVPG